MIHPSSFLRVLLVIATWVSMPVGEGNDDGPTFKLAPCPSSPNCVSSQSKSPRSAIQPLYFSGSVTDAQGLIRRLIEATRGARIARDELGYIHAEFSSRVFKFVDDVEFVLDAQTHTIDYRSASRTGYYDFGVNRRRLENFRDNLVQSADLSTVPLTPSPPEQDSKKRKR